MPVSWQTLQWCYITCFLWLRHFPHLRELLPNRLTHIFPCACLLTLLLSLLMLLLHSFHCLYVLSLLSPPPQHSPVGSVLYKPWGGFVLINPCAFICCSICFAGTDKTCRCDAKINYIWHFLDKLNILIWGVACLTWSCMYINNAGDCFI